MRSLVVTDLVASSVHLTSRLNSTAQSWQKLSHIQSWAKEERDHHSLAKIKIYHDYLQGL